MKYLHCFLLNYIHYLPYHVLNIYYLSKYVMYHTQQFLFLLAINRKGQALQKPGESGWMREERKRKACTDTEGSCVKMPSLLYMLSVFWIYLYYRWEDDHFSHSENKTIICVLKSLTESILEIYYIICGCYALQWIDIWDNLLRNGIN